MQQASWIAAANGKRERVERAKRDGLQRTDLFIYVPRMVVSAKFSTFELFYFCK
jgi:hypothetical protein